MLKILDIYGLWTSGVSLQFPDFTSSCTKNDHYTQSHGLKKCGMQLVLPRYNVYTT